MINNPYRYAAELYWSADWRGVLPLPPGAKHPPPEGWTGHDAPWPSFADIAAWAEVEPAANIGLRLPAGVIGIDVDAYDGKPGADTWLGLIAQHGEPEPTWISTARRGEGPLYRVSGIRFYRVPEGLNWRGAAGPGVEIVQTGHRYAVVWPSVHPTGSVYTWFDPDGEPTSAVPEPDQLSELPGPWIEALSLPYDRALPAGLDANIARQWLEATRGGPLCGKVQAVLDRCRHELAAGAGRHDTARDGLRALVALGGEGHAGVTHAVGSLADAFRVVVGRERDVRAEWDRMVSGAVQLAAGANPVPLQRCGCETVDELVSLVGGTASPDSKNTDNIPLSAKADPDEFFDRAGLLALKLAAAVEEAGPIVVGVGGKLWHYADGYYQAGGERVVRERVAQILGNRYRMMHAATVVDLFSTRRPFLTGEDERYWNVPNGLLDWRTGQLVPHTPDVPSTIRIPVEWRPEATCPEIESWLAEVFPADALQFVTEVIGYTLLNANPLHKAILLFGRGRNGKGTLLRLLTALVGRANVSSVTPQSLDDNRFRAAQLYGKLANLVGDVDPRTFTATETFKQITGGDLVTAEQKYGQPFEFYCRALMVAAFNALPRSADTSEGFFSRWIVLPFTGYFPPGVADPGREAKLHTKAELEGLLVLARRGLIEVMGRHQFSEPESVIEATGNFRRVADPVRAFLADHLPGVETEWQPRTQLHQAYVVWATRAEYRPLGAAAFYERVEAAARDTPGFIITTSKRQGTRGFSYQSVGGRRGSFTYPCSRRAYKRVSEPAPSAPSTCCNRPIAECIVDCGRCLQGR